MVSVIAVTLRSNEVHGLHANDGDMNPSHCPLHFKLFSSLQAHLQRPPWDGIPGGWIGAAFPSWVPCLLGCNLGFVVTSNQPSKSPGTEVQISISMQYEVQVNCS